MSDNRYHSDKDKEENRVVLRALKELDKFGELTPNTRGQIQDVLGDAAEGENQ